MCVSVNVPASVIRHGLHIISQVNDLYMVVPYYHMMIATMSTSIMHVVVINDC